MPPETPPPDNHSQANKVANLSSGGPAREDLDLLWSRHSAEWRDQAQVASQWQEANETDPQLLTYKVRGQWWSTLAALDITLLVTREYEHLLLALSVTNAKPAVSYMRLPHPSGLAVDRARGVVYIASTRNPNQVYDFKPVTGLMPRQDTGAQTGLLHDNELGGAGVKGGPLVPVRSRFYPGSMYMHDLAVIGGDLYANSVGQNAVVRLPDEGNFEYAWWPKSIETSEGPAFGQNYIQLNSIAAGPDLASSFFSASAAKLSRRRPGHKNFPVDRRGVIFSGATREPFASGLTRPHSARLWNKQIWVDNSGYGELGIAEDGKFKPVLKLPGWTRGLAFKENIAFVGTSQVIPRFQQYAPGLEVATSQCGLHAVDLNTGKVVGSLIWPSGNQIFAIDWLPAGFTSGFPFKAKPDRERQKILFYTFSTD